MTRLPALLIDADLAAAGLTRRMVADISARKQRGRPFKRGHRATRTAGPQGLVTLQLPCSINSPRRMPSMCCAR